MEQLFLSNSGSILAGSIRLIFPGNKFFLETLEKYRSIKLDGGLKFILPLIFT